MRATSAALALAVLWTSHAVGQPMYPWDMLNDPAYARAHRKMLGSQHFLPWIADLACAADPEGVGKETIGGEDWTTLQCCKPEQCADRLVIVYSERRGVAYGTFIVNSQHHYLGNPPAEIRQVLDDYAAPRPALAPQPVQAEPDRD